MSKKLSTGLACGTSLGCTVEEAFPLLKKNGIESTFTMVDTKQKLYEWADLAANYGLEYSSLHANFDKAAKMWDDTIEGDAAEKELFEGIDSCVCINVPVLVAHPFKGFYEHSPTDVGLDRYRRLAIYAEKKGVRIALENVEGEAHLKMLMDGLREYESVGFCLDTGHELCYNKGKDMLAEYGDRLCYLHINSNVGVTSPKGELTFFDDSHMLPFDGKADMERLARKLFDLGYSGTLMMELLKKNRPGRNTNDIYSDLTVEEYISEAAKRIKRLRQMILSLS